MNGKQKPLYKKRIDWLKRNRKLWHRYEAEMPGSFTIEKELLVRMKEAKLYSPGTTLLDVSLDKMIYRIRNEGRPRGLTFGRKKSLASDSTD